MKGYWRQFVPAVVVAALMLGAAYGPRIWEAAWEPWTTAWWQVGWRAGWAAGYAKGEVKSMASWLVEGAGDASYNGTYTESGTYNGKPAYTNGTRWLANSPDGTRWTLCTATGLADGYLSDGDSLPGNPWSVVGADAPAPTVTEAPTGPKISGYLLESDSTPVAGVTFRATKGATTVDSDPTDAAGYYEITGLENGNWIVSYLSGAAEPHKIFVPGVKGNPVVTISGEDATLDWTLYWGATGTVTAGGNGLPGVTADIYGSYGVLHATVQTDVNGVWVWSGYVSGYYSARFALTGYSFSPQSVSINLMSHAPVVDADSVATLRNKTLSGATVGQGTVSCAISQVHALLGSLQGAAQTSCSLQVVPAATKRRGYYYRYLMRLWSE